MQTPLITEAYNYVMPLIEAHCWHYFFHNERHTEQVFERVQYLADTEWISDIDREDLQIAALFHDIGFIEQYAKNEYIGSQIARKWLEGQHHDEKRIKKIERMIMATVIFSKPKTLLEQIMQDADLDNIGTEAGFENSLLIEKELKEIAEISIVGCQYWQYAYKIYHDFQFHTQAARAERNEWKEKNMKKIIAELESFWDCKIPYDPDYMAKYI